MGFSFKNSKKIAPRLRVTVSKGDVSLSAGNKRGGISKSTSRRATKHASISGTSVSWGKTKKL